MDTEASRLLYAIFDPERMNASLLQQVVDLSGVQEQPLETISAGSLCAIASRVPDAQRLASPPVEEVLTFQSVVEDVFAAGPVVPVRFGTVAHSADHAASLVREREATYMDALRRVDGRVEMGISVLLEADSESLEGGETGQKADSGGEAERRSGTAYLREKQQQWGQERARIEQAVKPYRAAIQEHISDVEVSTPTAAQDRVSLAFLVPRGEVDRFRQSVRQVQAPGASSVDIVGPWAPYSFV